MTGSPGPESPSLARTSTRSSLLDVPSMDAAPSRPSHVTHVSLPSYESPLRHHRRQPSTPHKVKETLHARSEYTNSEDDGAAIRRINQYIIKQEVGRGSFGAVHLAVDQYGNEFAVKEFSKSRLRRRAQSNILRRPGARSPGSQLSAGGINSPPHRRNASDIHSDEEAGNPLYLIREEIAIMKKLNHPNLVSLLEVLDDPTEDSLYMVLEMCKKGVVMKVGMHEPAEPYEPERCRTWFRDLILGIEYLHAQGVVHRDIKPDNLLLTEGDVLKIVDFGVSEMFEKDSDFMTTKSAGSPAFLPPELCISGHGQISGKAADIWSIGVTLYCLYFGRVPFEKINPLELYEAIRSEQADIADNLDEDLRDLFKNILEKDPTKRIQMAELRVHPWVTRRGSDPLLSTEDNVVDIVLPPTEEEMNRAITRNMNKLLVVVKAVRKFKQLLSHRRPEILDSILGQQLRMVSPPEPISSMKPVRMPLYRTRSNDIDERRQIEQALVREGIHHKIDVDKIEKPLTSRDDAAVLGRGALKPIVTESHHSKVAEDEGADNLLQKSPQPMEQVNYFTSPEDFHGKGQAHDPLSEEFQFLAVGSSAGHYPRTPRDSPPIVSESPSAAEENIYDTAYHDEVERIRKNSRSATIYMTQRVEDKQKYKDDRNMLGIGEDRLVQGFHRIVDKAKDARKQHEEEEDDEKREAKESGLKALIQGGASPTGLKKLKQAAIEDFKNNYQDMERSNITGSAKKLAEAAVEDIKDIPHNVSSRNEVQTDQKDNAGIMPAVKSTIKDLMGARQEQNSTEQDAGSGTIACLKAAVKEVKQAGTTNKIKKNSADNSMPGLEAVAEAAARKS